LAQFTRSLRAGVLAGTDRALSGQQRWFLTGYRLAIPIVLLAIGEQLSRYGDMAVLATMGSAVVLLLGFWGLTFIRPMLAMTSGLWVVSVVVWLAMAEGLFLLATNLPIGVSLIRELTLWIPIICAYWAMMLYASPRAAIAMVVVFNMLLLAADMHVRAATGEAILHGSPTQSALQIVILVVMVWIFGGVHGKVVSQRNIARSSAIRDPLTGLYNRLSFEYELRRVAQEADRYGRSFGLIVVDIDHFKRFNDRYGHLAGDEALETVALVCRRTLRRTDLISRWGGEEFAIIVHNATAEQAFRAAEKLRLAVAENETNVGEPITISCGVALFRTGEEPRTLFERADGALLLAKEHGRNRVMCCPVNEDATISGPPKS
jgi:diguanylate cyclase (GGDEF)-like protein